VADPKAKVVILGAGHAGGSAAAFLRQYGHEGPIVLIGDEPIPPYRHRRPGPQAADPRRGSRRGARTAHGGRRRTA